MTTEQRKRFFSDLWPAACAEQGWNPKDDQRRYDATKYATGVESTTGLEEYQITALFTYVIHLADLTSVEKAANWAECQRDPLAFNALRQAKYWEKRAGYKSGGRLHKNRFHGAVPETPFDPSMPRKDAEQLRMTARERARSKERRAKLSTTEGGDSPQNELTRVNMEADPASRQAHPGPGDSRATDDVQADLNSDTPF